MNPCHDRLKESVLQILACSDDFYQMKQSVDCMYSIYRSISDVNADDQNDAHIIVPSGKAISPSMAAHCLLEMKRTAIFLRGIHETIEYKIKERKNSPIYLLYAGTGPYATLVTPLLLLYKPSEIKVDLIDINPISLNSAVKVLNELGLKPFIGSVYLADAAVFQPEKNYDVVISETMQAALKKEPQVAIMQNLIPQMKQEAIFIPEAITIDAELVSRGKWNEETVRSEGVQRIHLGKILTVDRQHLDAGNNHKVVRIPDEVGECKQLKFYTTIKVFGNHWLLEGDCSLNIPLKVCELDEDEGKTIIFWYEQGEIPGIHFQFAGSSSQYAAIGKTYCIS
jgi:predicted RNA methylase